ncbi:ATP-binding protein [Pontibacter silvestris]|uniref:histidine kinase n=1 Tax=Pontibacter silvestris TaxID=2305183 RepID=A0ABW4WVW5_9BACT|nr:PAS domain-containing sensor histidine kinase [Pontibacter silvestris]MCC9137022.1 PAS domain-containing protein [Pontibacter silvestris]
MQSDQVFFLYNLRTRHVDFINPNFQKIWEVSKKEYSEESLWGSIYPDDRSFVEESYHDFLNGESSKKIEFRILLQKDVVKWLSLFVYYIFEGNVKSFIVGLVEDITKRKELEHLSAQNNSRKSAVLEILSHDLKGSIALINVMNEEVKKHVQALGNEQVNEYTRLIGQVCKNNLDMIHSLLNVEFLESASMQLTRKRLDLVQLIKNVFDEYKHSEKLLDRCFKLLSANESVYVEVDEVLFTQVFNNLISNAVKFTREGGAITVSLEEDKERVLVCVKDNGIGIPKSLQPFLFDRFSKARRPGNKGQKSTGLGMSIVKRIVELHGGKTWVESEEKKGTSIFFNIPKI